MWHNLDNGPRNKFVGFMDNRQNSFQESKVTTQRGDNTVPVLIRHLQATYSDLEVRSTIAHIITFVGILRSIEQSTTKLTCKIEDETGIITAFQWLQSDKQTAESQFKLNTYVRVYGHLRQENSVNHVLILKIRPVTELNELVNHLLEVTHVMLKARRMSSTSSGQSEPMNIVNTFISDNISGLTKEQTLIFKIIQLENDSINGIERSVIKTRVPRNILPHIDDIIDFLTSEGHIYTTLTDDHFKTT